MIKKTKRSLEWIKNEQLGSLSSQVSDKDLYWGDHYAGIHLIAEFWGGKIVEDKRELKNILVQAARESKSTALGVKVHKFLPQGIAGVVLLAESHISFHSWPEKKYAAVDIFTCGKNTDPFKALKYLRAEFQPKRVKVKEIKRGKEN